jgi:ornithine carbamoyltransferase
VDTIRSRRCHSWRNETAQPCAQRRSRARACAAKLTITDNALKSEANVAFEQAENRMHTIKALLVATLGD